MLIAYDHVHGMHGGRVNSKPRWQLRSTIIAGLIGAALCASRVHAQQGVTRIIITSLRTPDSLGSSAASAIRDHASTTLGASVRVLPGSQVDAIRDVAYNGNAVGRPASVAELCELARLLRASYVIDVQSRKIGPDYEVSGVRFASGDSSSKKVLAPVRANTLADAAMQFAQRVAAEGLLK
jgi:hypothetical protein